MRRPAVFLDRDGTLIEDLGYLRDPSQVVFFPDAFDAARRLASRYELFIVTNQNGVSKGLISLQEADRVNAYVAASLTRAGAPIREVYSCPHAREEGCLCIKPNPHFPRLAERDHGIDLAASWTIGDHAADVELAASVGARGIFVLTGHGRSHRDELKVPCRIVDGIGAAADFILSEPHGSLPPEASLGYRPLR